MREITFNAERISLPEINQDKVRKWLEAIAQRHDKIIGEINYLFTDDDGILKINREFLQHDYYTDIITFDYSKRRVISGDIYISLDTVRSNAESMGETYDRELHRVIIHGVLHLVGINDKGPGEREIMENFENEALEMLQRIV